MTTRDKSMPIQFIYQFPTKETMEIAKQKDALDEKLAAQGLHDRDLDDDEQTAGEDEDSYGEE